MQTASIVFADLPSSMCWNEPCRSRKRETIIQT